MPLSRPDEHVSPVARHKRYALCGLFAYSAALGIAFALLPDEAAESRAADLLVALPILFLASAWCSLDALERGFRMSRALQVGLVLLFGVAFPVYVFKSRGLAGFMTLARAALLGLALLATAVGTCAATCVAAEVLHTDPWPEDAGETARP